MFKIYKKYIKYKIISKLKDKQLVYLLKTHEILLKISKLKNQNYKTKESFEEVQKFLYDEYKVYNSQYREIINIITLIETI